MIAFINQLILPAGSGKWRKQLCMKLLLDALFCLFLFLFSFPVIQQSGPNITDISVFQTEAFPSIKAGKIIQVLCLSSDLTIENKFFCFEDCPDLCIDLFFQLIQGDMNRTGNHSILNLSLIPDIDQCVGILRQTEQLFNRYFLHTQ